MRPPIRPLKGLGQHFLNDRQIAEQIADSLIITDEFSQVLEIGPGTGVLTEFLIDKVPNLFCIEVDERSVHHLEQHFPALKGKIMFDDFLSAELGLLDKENYAVIGNFPYNISSQILFRILEDYTRVPQIVGMFQKEVAQRLTSPPGNKNYGILSVLLQAHYDCEYLFTVPPHVFIPPPKVDSGVIRLRLKKDHILKCDPVAFKKVIKTGFNQRRKTLRNSLRSILPPDFSHIPFLDLRPEQLHYTQFEQLAILLK